MINTAERIALTGVDFSDCLGMVGMCGFIYEESNFDQYATLFNLTSRWGIRGLDIDMFSMPPFDVMGKTIMLTDLKGGIYKTEIEGPFWGDMWQAADMLINMADRTKLHSTSIVDIEDDFDGNFVVTLEVFEW